MKLKNIINIILMIIWLLIIFLFSAQESDKSLNTSEHVIIKTVETIKGEKLTEKEKDILIDKFLFIVRKSAHFFLYFILGIFVFFIAKNVWGLTRTSFIYTIIFCLIYACSDELHQLFISGRTARILDVLIDTSGSLLSTFILFTLHIIKNRIKSI